MPRAEDLWGRLVRAALASPEVEIDAATTRIGPIAPSSADTSRIIEAILSAVDEIEEHAIARILCEYAYSLLHDLDPSSKGTGALKFRTGLKAVIKQKLEKKKHGIGSIDRSQDITRMRGFCKRYREINDFDHPQAEDVQSGTFRGNVGATFFLIVLWLFAVAKHLSSMTKFHQMFKAPTFVVMPMRFGTKTKKMGEISATLRVVRYVLEQMTKEPETHLQSMQKLSPVKQEMTHVEDLWGRLVRAALTSSEVEIDATTTCIGAIALSSADSSRIVEAILSAVDEIEEHDPIIARILCEYAYPLLHDLDPSSEGTGALKFRTGSRAVIKQKLEKKKHGRIDRSQNITRMRGFYKRYREINDSDHPRAEGMQSGIFHGNLGGSGSKTKKMGDISATLKIMKYVLEQMDKEQEMLPQTMQELSPDPEMLPQTMQELSPEPEMLPQTMQELSPEPEMLPQTMQELSPEPEMLPQTMQELSPEEKGLLSQLMEAAVLQLQPSLLARSPIPLLPNQPASVELLSPDSCVLELSSTVTAVKPEGSQEVRPFLIDPALRYRGKNPGVKRFLGARV